MDRAIAGFISALPIQLAHPLDLIKVRMQVADPAGNSNVPPIKGYTRMAITIYQTEGLRAFYKGMLFSTIPNFLIAAYFALTPIMKRALIRNQYFSQRQQQTIVVSNFLVSGILAILTTPLYVLKTRKLTDVNRFEETKSISKIGSEVRHTMGATGFWRGASMTFMMGLNGGLTLALIDLFRSNTALFEANSANTFLISGSVRVLTSLVFYPFSTIRARVEQNQFFGESRELKYSGILDCVGKTYRAEGVKGFYKGFWANTTRAFIMTGSLMGLYPFVHKKLRNSKEKANF